VCTTVVYPGCAQQWYTQGVKEGIPRVRKRGIPRVYSRFNCWRIFPLPAACSCPLCTTLTTLLTHDHPFHCWTLLSTPSTPVSLLVNTRPRSRLSLIMLLIPDSRDVRKFPDVLFPECENLRVYGR